MASAKAPSVVGEAEEACVGGEESGSRDGEVGGSQALRALQDAVKSSGLF